MKNLPDPRLHDPVMDCVKALRGHGVISRRGARDLLPLWADYRRLTRKQTREVLAHFPEHVR